MKKIFISLTIFLSVISSLNADDHVEFGAMEGLQCNFADGKDMDDVMKVLSCLLYTSPSPRDATLSRMPSSA